MNMFFRLTALAGLLAIAGQTFAVEDITRADQIPVLKEETQHATVSERVTSRFTRSHYRQFDLDQAFSAKIFDRYLNLLDYSHNVLLASDVEQFAKKKTELGDELRSGKLDVFYDLYNLAQKRRLNVTSTLCRYWKSRWISPATTLITLTAAKRLAEKRG